MGKTHSKPLAARHGRGTAWARHAMCESAFIPRGSWYRRWSEQAVITDKKNVTMLVRQQAQKCSEGSRNFCAWL